MKKILALALFAVALVSCRQTMQTDGFKLSGHLEGLQVGIKNFHKTFLLPDWKEDGDIYHMWWKRQEIFWLLFLWKILLFILLMHLAKMGEPLR